MWGGTIHPRALSHIHLSNKVTQEEQPLKWNRNGKSFIFISLFSLFFCFSIWIRESKGILVCCWLETLVNNRNDDYASWLDCVVFFCFLFLLLKVDFLLFFGWCFSKNEVARQWSTSIPSIHHHFQQLRAVSCWITVEIDKIWLVFFLFSRFITFCFVLFIYYLLFYKTRATTKWRDKLWIMIRKCQVKTK